MKSIPSVAIAAFLLVSTTHAEIYRHVDSNGNVFFSDQPPENSNAVRVELPPVNTIRHTPPPQSRPANLPAAPVNHYTRLQLESSLGTLASNPSTPLVVSARPDIALQPGHRLVFFISGKEKALADGAMSVTLGDVPRGQHTFSAEIRDAKGGVLIRSEPLTVQIHRTAAPPARVAPR